MVEKKTYPAAHIGLINDTLTHEKILKTGIPYLKSFDEQVKEVAENLIDNYNKGVPLPEYISGIVTDAVKTVLTCTKPTKPPYDEKEHFMKIHNMSIDTNEVALSEEQRISLKIDISLGAEYAKSMMDRNDVYDYVTSDLDKVISSYK